MKVAEFIRNKHRDGESQSAIARRCNISQSLVNKMIHQDFEPTLDTIKKIAVAYRVPLFNFIDGDTLVKPLDELPEGLEQAVMQDIEIQKALANTKPPRIDMDLLAKANKTLSKLTKDMPVSEERKIEMLGSLYEDYYEDKYDDDKGNKDETKE